MKKCITSINYYINLYSTRSDESASISCCYDCLEQTSISWIEKSNESTFYKILMKNDDSNAVTGIHRKKTYLSWFQMRLIPKKVRFFIERFRTKSARRPRWVSMTMMMMWSRHCVSVCWLEYISQRTDWIVKFMLRFMSCSRNTFHHLIVHFIIDCFSLNNRWIINLFFASQVSRLRIKRSRW